MNPYPKRRPSWTCPTCGAKNEDGSAYCLNNCRQDGKRVRGPLAVPRPDQPDKKRGKR